MTKEKIEVPAKTQEARPFVKWAGGKGSLLKTYEPLFPDFYRGYFEPFVGGGAVFFHLRPGIPYGIPMVLADTNQDLITTYRMLQANSDWLIEKLQELATLHSEATYYQWRAMQPLTQGDAAVRFMYLARAAFNGLWRTNKKGQHNVPVGRDNEKRLISGERLFDYDNLRRVGRALQGVSLHCLPFWECGTGALRQALAWNELFVYADPPYVKIKDGSFTAYGADGFSLDDHKRLRDTALEWHERGAQVMLSNSDCPFVRELYSAPVWNLTEVSTHSPIAATKAARGKRAELVIRNYT